MARDSGRGIDIYVPGAFDQASMAHETENAVIRAISKCKYIGSVTEGRAERGIISRKYGPQFNRRNEANTTHIDALYYRLLGTLENCDLVVGGIDYINECVIGEYIVALKAIIPILIFLHPRIENKKMPPIPFSLEGVTLVQYKDLPKTVNHLERVIKELES